MEAATDIEARPAGAESDEPVRVVEPVRGWRFPDFREIWHHRDLVYLMVRRDISVRYRQSAIGALWAILQPLLLAVVFSVFLGHYANVPSAPGSRIHLRGLRNGDVALLRERDDHVVGKHGRQLPR